jgi:DNA-binding transcriptional LysR family regulator
MDRDRLPQLALFAEVARTGGFRAAARQLGMSPSAVSHAVGALEARLGMRLLNRTTRSLALTEAGQRLLGRLGPALGEIEEAMRDAHATDTTPAGPVRVTAPRSATLQMIGPHLAAFAEAYPSVAIDLVVEDRFVDIVAEGFDIGLRLGENLQPDMIATQIGGPQRFTIVASPAYIDRHGAPLMLEDLARHRCLVRRFTGGGVYQWEVVRDGAEITLGAARDSFTTNDDQLMVRAVLDGMGIAFLHEHRIADYLASGELVELFPDNCPPFPGYYLYHASRRHMRPAVRAFIDFFVAANRPAP